MSIAVDSILCYTHAEGCDESVNVDLKAELKKRARDLGFDAVGVAPAQRLDRAERAIEERVRAGLLRDYGFALKPASHFTSPDTILPGAKSVVVVAISYSNSDRFRSSFVLRPSTGSGWLRMAQDGGTYVEGNKIRGLVARFARGRDYHAVVQERLRELGDWLKEQAGASYRICVDTGPIIDRAAAREAGVGSYGKNAAIITREAGSWVVLGELVTDAEIDPDKPAPMEECGDCSICVRACPSGAIACPFVIDQTKCISHLTQMKGSIPVELRPLIGDRVYGCDVCQEVCPKNRGVQSGRFPMEGGLGARPELIPLLNISREDFDRLISPTAIGWIGRTRFRRNVAVALGNIGDPRAVPELQKAAEDPDPIVREHAGWVLGECNTTCPGCSP